MNKRQKLIPLNKLNLTDRFLFEEVMEDPLRPVRLREVPLHLPGRVRGRAGMRSRRRGDPDLPEHPWNK